MPWLLRGDTSDIDVADFAEPIREASRRGYCYIAVTDEPSKAISFGPEALKVIRDAFDAAWSSMAGNFVDEPTVVETARQESCGERLLFGAKHDTRRSGCYEKWHDTACA